MANCRRRSRSSVSRAGRKAMTISARRWRKRRASFRARQCAMKSGKHLRKSLFYHQSEFGDEAGYKTLAERLDKIDEERGTRGNRLFYFAVAPEQFETDPEESEGGRIEQGQRRKLGARDRRKTIRHRSRLGARIESRRQQCVSEKADLPDRSFSRQRNRAEHFGAAFRQRDFRAALEHALHRSRPDHRGGNARRGRARRLLRRRRARCATWCKIICSSCFASSRWKPPTDLGADSIRDEKVKVVRSLRRMIAAEVAKNVVRGQYAEARSTANRCRRIAQEKGVDPKSMTETYRRAAH